MRLPSHRLQALTVVVSLLVASTLIRRAAPTPYVPKTAQDLGCWCPAVSPVETIVNYAKDGTSLSRGPSSNLNATVAGPVRIESKFDHALSLFVQNHNKMNSPDYPEKRFVSAAICIGAGCAGWGVSAHFRVRVSVD
jgi:hypothetical protein